MTKGLTDVTSKVGYSAGVDLIRDFFLESEMSWVAIKNYLHIFCRPLFLIYNTVYAFNALFALDSSCLSVFMSVVIGML